MSALPSHWLMTLHTLSGAWAEVRAEVAATHDTRRAQRLTAWRDALDTLRAEQASLQAQGLWAASGPADLLSVAGLGRRETVHTAALAWLLRPAKEHGLGARLLNAVLATLGLPPVPPEDHARVRVSTEETRKSRRADIVARWPRGALVIEAKVDAEEAPRQCDDLFELFGDEPGVSFVFLTPTGRRPSSATGPAAEAFLPLSFPQVRACLTDVIDGAQGPGAHAVRDYLHTLDAHFSPRAAMQIDARLRFYFENKAVLDEWAALAWEARGAADRFFRTFADPLRALQEELGPDVHLYTALDGSFPKFVLARTSWGGGVGLPRVGVGLEWSKNGAAFEKAHTGVWVNRTNPRARRRCLSGSASALTPSSPRSPAPCGGPSTATSPPPRARGGTTCRPSRTSSFRRCGPAGRRPRRSSTTPWPARHDDPSGGASDKEPSMKTITRILIEGFRSLQDVTFEPGPLTVLIGPNGAGKSNVLSFLRMLTLMGTRSLRLFCATEGGASTLLHRGPPDAEEIGWRVETSDEHGRIAFGGRLAQAAGDQLVFSDEYVEGACRGGDPLGGSVRGLGKGIGDVCSLALGTSSLRWRLRPSASPKDRRSGAMDASTDVLLPLSRHLPKLQAAEQRPRRRPSIPQVRREQPRGVPPRAEARRA
ncbi:MAG: PD-(D/E)XK nuclease family protein [Deltaproteobacteria bacterium]|nr:PD-(D/E)XK nuclease family protein [Deltaproteobacteria bacterium]